MQRLTREEHRAKTKWESGKGKGAIGEHSYLQLMADMSNRRAPVKSSDVSTVNYPSELFSLERDEIYPYDRLAYNVLEIAVGALHAQGLSQRITVDFSAGSTGTAPWSINASVRCNIDDNKIPTGFDFLFPELFPALAYVYCSCLEPEQHPGYYPTRKALLRFADCVRMAAGEYRRQGLAVAIRECYEYLKLSIWDASKIAPVYDLLTKSIAYHEVGHIYARHLTVQGEVNSVRRRGFELIADLLAIVWMYNVMVVHTPDDETYRTEYGFSSYSEAIFSNCSRVQATQIALLPLMAFTGAMQNNGRVTLEGGASHPPGLQRQFLQHVVFSTLVATNFSNVLSEQQLVALNQDWDEMVGLLIQEGIVTRTDVLTMADPRECDPIEAAAITIQEMEIEELLMVLPTLSSWRDTLSDVVRRHAGTK